jgi:hypothetical protein
LRNTITSHETPACYRADVARMLVRHHVAGHDNHTMALHKMLTIQLIERLFARHS